MERETSWWPGNTLTQLAALPTDQMEVKTFTAVTEKHHNAPFMLPSTALFEWGWCGLWSGGEGGRCYMKDAVARWNSKGNFWHVDWGSPSCPHTCFWGKYLFSRGYQRTAYLSVLNPVHLSLYIPFPPLLYYQTRPRVSSCGTWIEGSRGMRNSTGSEASDSTGWGNYAALQCIKVRYALIYFHPSRLSKSHLCSALLCFFLSFFSMEISLFYCHWPLWLPWNSLAVEIGK